jgi:LemA protein
MAAKGRTIGLIVIVVIALAAGFGCQYNKFATQNETVRAAFAEVDNQLQRRSDLIPNLVETVKGFAQQEKDVFGAVAAARAQMAGANTPVEKIEAAKAETSALARLLVVVEAYPQLKSDANFMRLQDELANTENRLAVARMRYNEQVKTFNTMLVRFPNNLIAGMFGFAQSPYFDVPEASKQLPKVDFGGRGKD